MFKLFYAADWLIFYLNAGVYQLPAELEDIAIPNEAELLGRRG
jgi:hypothetical protein